MREPSSRFNANYSANWIRDEAAAYAANMQHGFNANYSANWIRENFNDKLGTTIKFQC